MTLKLGLLFMMIAGAAVAAGTEGKITSTETTAKPSKRLYEMRTYYLSLIHI